MLVKTGQWSVWYFINEKIVARPGKAQIANLRQRGD